MHQHTQDLLDKGIRRLGGEAVSPLRETAIATEHDGREEPVPAPAPPPTIDIGHHVWLGSALIDPAVRKGGTVIDASGEDCVVVVRDRLRRQRQEAWVEVWPITELDPEDHFAMTSTQRIQVAKRICTAIGETVNAGRWNEADEALFMAAARLSAPYSGGRTE